jgi:large subunit ribosomal protein L16|nr:ribosomal protein L16 [Meringosphaera mediterranea]
MLSPKRTKFRKHHRGRMKGSAVRNNQLSFGEYGLQSQECGWITSRQIEATRRTITRAIKRGGKLWITIFPDQSVTARAAESRMGSGKGAVDFWIAVIKPGHILFELGGVSVDLAKNAMHLASYKLPVKTKFIQRVVK